jgi:diamine N-acetyltransferase
MNLHFRTAQVADAPVIQQLAHKIWHQHYPDIISVEQINFMLADRYSINAITTGLQKGEIFYLAYLDETPVALADIELKGDHYFLHKFYVDVASHRGGIGSRFFEYLLQQTDARKPIRLQVNRQNYKAINFYFKKGFVIEGVGDFDIGGGFTMNDFVMIKH